MEQAFRQAGKVWKAAVRKARQTVQADRIRHDYVCSQWPSIHPGQIMIVYNAIHRNGPVEGEVAAPRQSNTASAGVPVTHAPANKVLV